MTTPLVIGIVGGIGSGKSEVARVLAAEAEAPILSGDETGHHALRDPEIRKKVLEIWGDDLLNEEGEIDRKKLGAIVFGKGEDRQRLEAIVHPWIKEQLQAQLEQLKAQEKSSLIVLDAAIMLEASWSQVCDHLIFVDVPSALRKKRILENRGWTEKEVESREKAQWSLEKKRKHCDHVLNNSGSLEDLHRQVVELLHAWQIVPVSKRKQA